MLGEVDLNEFSLTHDTNDRNGLRHEGGSSMSDETMRILVLIFVILYVISPLDGCPGPIDDLIVIIMGFAARKRLKT